MASSFEQLIFEILATDKNASAAFDRFRQKVDQTSKSVDDNSKSMDKNAKSIDNLGTSASKTTPLLGGLGGASGMGLLIGAGVALSPVIATVGAGLTGLGLAAFGVVSPVLKAAQAAGGLQANMAKLDPEQQKLAQSLLGLGKQYDKFQKSLQPQVLGIFGKGIQLAGHLMGDLQPIAKNTGIALQQVLGRIDAEFKSGTWQQFFGFMARQAGPDVQLLGNLIIDLTKTLPPLLQDLQPVATGLLKLADAAVKAADGYTSFIKAQAHKADQPGSFGKQIRNLAHDLLRTSVNADQLKASQDALNKRLSDGKVAAADLIHPVGTFTSGLQAAHVATVNEATAVTHLTTALMGLSTNLLTSQADQVAWRQAQQAATQAIKANTGSLNTNKSTALAARAAIIQSTQAALTFADQEVKVHHNVDAASTVLRAQIAWLQTHAAHSRVAAAEVNALRGALAQLHSKAITLTEHGIGRFSIFGRNTSSTPALAGGAQGMFINRGTTPTADDVLIRASKGELVVPTKMVSAGLVDHLRGLIPGFATGGLAGQTTAFDSSFQSQFTGAMKSAMTAAMRSAISAAQSAIAFHLHGGGALGGSSAANRAIAMRMFPWPMSMFPSFDYVEMREAGYSLTAQNPSSGAYGMAQFINGPGEYAQWGGNATTAGGQLVAMFNYIRSRYGTPVAAAAHEASFNWYDRGGWLPPGPSLVYNGTGQPERVLPPGRGRGPVMVVENLHVREAADVDLLARRLAFLDA